ncbi:MAG TPA: glutamate 5-kinase [Acidimicrobiales bacterium]|nr:glutamate 5-kinase [Acidimicrobiales bacterium]
MSDDGVVPGQTVPPRVAEPTRTVVAKVGSSSLTASNGDIDVEAIDRLCAEVAELHGRGHSVVLVTSGAIAAGWSALGGGPRPTDPAVLQAVSAVGQHRLMRVYDDALAARGLHVGQVLLAPLDFVHRQQYLHARQTLAHLIELGVVPVVNENDATSDDEIRFGDNDRLAALVAHLVASDLLVLLTDRPGLLSADPRTTAQASLIEEVVEVDQQFEAIAGGPGSVVGSGGMVSKLAAAKIASWSGVETVIGDARRPGVLTGAVEGRAVGTVVRARARRLPARRLWIAFAVASAGTLVVDDGARRAVVEREASLLPVGVVAVKGRFDVDDAVEIAGSDGVVFAKGLVRHPAERIESWLGRRTSELPEGTAHEIVHRDDLVVLV